MRLKKAATLLITAFALATNLPTSAPAHHPGADLDKLMGSKERYFQVIDEPAPAFELADADGRIVRLSDFADKIVVLNFIFASCTDVCPLHSSLIADVQAKINATPMKDMVQFISVTTDPAVDTPEVMRSYGEPRGLDPYNWIFLTQRPGDPEDATRSLSETYNIRFEPRDDGQQTHGVVTHIIDKEGRFAAKFHGLRFEPLNLVLYINGLSNAVTPSAQPMERGLWDKFKDLMK